MNIDKFISSLQSSLSVSKPELYVSLIIVCGLLIGLLVTDVNADKSRMLEKKLNQLALNHQTTYTGIDNDGNIDKDIAKGDTVIKKKSPFPSKNKDNTPETSDEKININTASKVELMRIKGIGPKTAEKIINYRNKTLFESIEDIKKVKGIGPKKFEKMKSKIIVE